MFAGPRRAKKTKSQNVPTEEKMTTVNDSVPAPARTGLTAQHWLALCSGFLGWLFDSMDLNLFSLVLFPSVAELIQSRNPAEVAQIGAYIVAIKLFCWGLGGVVFGVVATGSVAPARW
jgi:hypothetical protein